MPPTIRPGTIVNGPTLPEAIEVLAVVPMGSGLKVIGRGMETGLTRDPILSPAQVAQLTVSADREPFDGDARMFRLGIEAMRLGLAYEYDPYFSLSIARVDPLPHQLEAVYDHFLKLPRIRFLLADDPGAGKTVMAGLLLKELKARGLAKRVLIVTPANLTFQWQREMKDKFRETFSVIRSDVLRANYGQNPWQEVDQVITSISWVSRVEDARESLLRSRWDLIIVDEAHRMAAYADDRKTLAFRLGESLSTMTDHYLLMTATPHKGDPENFVLFLSLLDKDAYGDVKSLQAAMRKNEAPFYLRRTKEALVTFPDPVTGEVRKLFTKRDVRTAEFFLDGEELDFYDQLTHYVEDQSIRASSEDATRGRAVGFTMALLQRRMASTIYAVRRTLERMKEKREQILEDPEGYRQTQIDRKIPDDFEELEEEEQQEILATLEEVVASVDPATLREEIARLEKLIIQARALEKREIESKLTRLRKILTEHGVFADPLMKVLIFTEHKDSLDFLVERLREWGLTVAQIHGGMKIGDRDTPGTRIYAEREFRENCQVLVATEAAGEGINLQFCWFMVNYDIPWSPVRLEQRVGRIHRYGQQHDCLVFNFVAQNTREGRVLQKLLDRLKEIRKELGTDQVFDVVGEVMPAATIERLFREMYLRHLDVNEVEDRIVRDVDPARFRAITESALEGLARRELNLSSLTNRASEAKERRLVPEVIEDFFVASAPEAGLSPKPTAPDGHIYRIGKVPRLLIAIGDRQEPRFGRIGREFGKVVFDKKLLGTDPTVEWVTPGHPLFEAVRTEIGERATDDLRRGGVFYDLHREEAAVWDVFSASVKDGRGSTLHRRLFIVETAVNGSVAIRQPTGFHDIMPAPKGTITPGTPLPSRQASEQHLYTESLGPWLDEIAAERSAEVDRVAHHVEISLQALIDRQQLQLADFLSRQESGRTVAGLDGIIAQAEQHLDALNNRLDARRKELELERHCTVSDLVQIGRAWVLPHPERHQPQFAPMVRDPRIERIAVETAMAYERARGWVVESVESEDRGFDLISRKPHREDPKTFTEVRFIEVKGRASVGDVALTSNEHRTAERLREDYWLYFVFNCVSTPELRLVQDPARLGWQPVIVVEHYRLAVASLTAAATLA